MSLKVPKKLKVLRALTALFLLPIALFWVASLYTAITDSDGRHYEKMKQICDTEMWVVVSDSPWYHLQKVEKPYPAKKEDIAGSRLAGLACSEQEANEKRESLDKSHGLFYFAGMGAFLVAPVVLFVIVWWAIEESRYFSAR